jgi:Na+:H+ antiporter, NhaA family
LIAIVWANSPFAPSYFDLFGKLLFWINDGLMALFFLLVGLEIKRELVLGELSTRQKAALPVIAAAGGMIAPALIFVAFNQNSGAIRGWGVPMATDIAFALGALALLGSRVPYALKVLLAAIAIADDLGAVLVIALFYTSSLHWGAVLGMAACMAVLILMNRAVVRSPMAYMAVGVVLWIFTHESGVHATISGVLLAIAVPTRVYLSPTEFLREARAHLKEFEDSCEGEERALMTEDRQVALHALEKSCELAQMPLERIEDALGPWVRYGIMPLFALANAGVPLVGIGSELGSPAALGVILGLCVGKPLGITLASWVSVKLGWAKLPAGVRWRQLAGVGVVAGIGFTMSLFIANLAGFTPEGLRVVKAAVLLASVLSGVLGYLWLNASYRTRRRRQTSS